MISIQSVSKSFKGFRAVKDLSLHINDGEYVALLGPNGAGKTTLVEMIEGLQQPDSGQITIDGKNWQHDAKRIRRMMGISLQETKFPDKMTVRETLNLFGSFYGLNKERSMEMLDKVNLKEKKDTYVVNLSGGQRQKMALGVALLNEPQLLLLDEPTTGLDPNARREIWDILLTLKQRQRTTLIMTTHYMEEAASLCDRILIMDCGNILADGTLQSLLQAHASGELIDFELDRPAGEAVWNRIPGFLSLEWKQPNQGQLTVESIREAVPVFLALLQSEGVDIRELECRKKTLDDLFVAMTGRSLQA
jgi:ABC-2 type transport system ATP-binding protein